MQFALLDLGFTMPRSTGNAASSPDGIYGDETTQVVKLFQKGVPGLSQDGVVGPQTIRALDQRGGGFRHRVRLHFRSIALTNVPFERSLATTEAVCAQYGIRIEPRTAESMSLTPQQRSTNPVRIAESIPRSRPSTCHAASGDTAMFGAKDRMAWPGAAGLRGSRRSIAPSPGSQKSPSCP